MSAAVLSIADFDHMMVDAYQGCKVTPDVILMNLNDYETYVCILDEQAVADFYRTTMHLWPCQLVHQAMIGYFEGIA